MNYNVLAYAVYAPVAIGLTIWVARMLHKNTSAFLKEIFVEHEKVAEATNNLLQVGFYLLSLGYAFVRLRMRGKIKWENGNWEYNDLESYRQMIEELAGKIGAFSLFIGFMLFFNLFLMLLMRRTKKNKNIPVAVPTYVQGQQKIG
ncbi:MAG TPA: hypothetical protein VGF30_16675 [Bacteroidia bacterium]